MINNGWSERESAKLSKRMWEMRKLGIPEWMARQSAGFGNHYQAVAKITGLHLISKEILAKRGLLSCLGDLLRMNRRMPNGMYGGVRGATS